MTIPPAVLDLDLDLRLDCNDPPSITVEDRTLEGNTTGGYAGAIPGVSAADPDGDQPVLVNDAPGVLPLGATTVTWTALDADGERATATQQVTVVDTTAPVLTCPADARDGRSGRRARRGDRHRRGRRRAWHDRRGALDVRAGHHRGDSQGD